VLHLAALLGHEAVTTVLLTMGANIKAKANGSTPLHLAVLGRYEALWRLSDNWDKEKVKACGRTTALHTTVSHGQKVKWNEGVAKAHGELNLLQAVAIGR
jgi:hypothetical protein